jgi:hypothetical protein
MRLSILALGAFMSLAGCMSDRLRQRTVNQGGTLPELQYQQVLANLALFYANPSALPWHINLREGTTQITDSATFGAAVDLGPPAETLPQIFGSRTAVAQWGGVACDRHARAAPPAHRLSPRPRITRDARP